MQANYDQQELGAKFKVRQLDFTFEQPDSCVTTFSGMPS